MLLLTTSGDYSTPKTPWGQRTNAGEIAVPLTGSMPAKEAEIDHTNRPCHPSAGTWRAGPALLVMQMQPLDQVQLWLSQNWEAFSSYLRLQQGKPLPLIQGLGGRKTDHPDEEPSSLLPADARHMDKDGCQWPAGGAGLRLGSMCGLGSRGGAGVEERRRGGDGIEEKRRGRA